ncbi:MAG: AAA family ATPase [Eubacterium sp.]|nr:AAA family ATPase [Eubacterium sp.]
MKLLKITLKNFLGTRNQTYEFNGKNATIYGRNGTGKTTVYSAYTWLLFGKVEDTTDFTPKVIDGDDYAHNLDTEVEAVFQTENGRLVTFKKIFKEVYKKKRGNTTAELTGNTTDHYIDGVPVKEKDYISTVENYCGDMEKIKLLTMPRHFAEVLDWKDRRKLLLEVCGDMTDEDVINSNPELIGLYKYLLIEGTLDQYRSVEEYKKIAVKRKADINKNLDVLPARIDEAEKAIPDTTGIDKAAIEAAIAKLEEDKNKLIEERAAANVTGNSATVKHVAELQAELANKQAEYMDSINKANEATNAAIAAEQANYSKYTNDLLMLNNEIGLKESSKTRLENELDELREEYKILFSVKWDANKEICPTCGQRLQPDKITAMRAAFNKDRSDKLTEIDKKGKANSKAIADYKKELAELREKAETVNANKEESQKLTRTLLAQKVAPNFAGTDDFKTITAQIAEGNIAIAKGNSDTNGTIAAINEKIAAVDVDIKAEREKLSSFKTAATQRERIADLEKQEKELAAEYEELEKGIYLCDLFTKTKVEALNERINSKFKTIRFRLFTTQINGGLKEGCEILVRSKSGNMIPYSATKSTVNDGAKPIAGLEVIDVLSEYWGIKMPVFVDNAESITEPFAVNTQVICLCANKDDDILRLEVA